MHTATMNAATTCSVVLFIAHLCVAYAHLAYLHPPFDKGSLKCSPLTQTFNYEFYYSDPQTDVASGVTRGCNMRSKIKCSACPAIHTAYRS